MKENFSIVIESYHIADRGTQENVSGVVLEFFFGHKIYSILMFNKTHKSLFFFFLFVVSNA